MLQWRNGQRESRSAPTRDENDASIETAIIDPGKPWQNGTNESFNGKFRDECLSVEWFRTRREAQVIIEGWRQHFNAIRPHSTLDYLTPFRVQAAPSVDNRSITPSHFPGMSGANIRTQVKY